MRLTVTIRLHLNSEQEVVTQWSTATRISSKTIVFVIDAPNFTLPKSKIKKYIVLKCNRFVISPKTRSEYHGQLLNFFPHIRKIYINGHWPGCHNYISLYANQILKKVEERIKNYLHLESESLLVEFELNPNFNVDVHFDIQTRFNVKCTYNAFNSKCWPVVIYHITV